MLNDKQFTSRDQKNSGAIGGSSQLLKVYRYCSVLPFTVRWGSPVSRVHLFGRPLLHFEITTLPILDPSNMSVAYPLQSISNASDLTFDPGNKASVRIKGRRSGGHSAGRHADKVFR